MKKPAQGDGNVFVRIVRWLHLKLSRLWSTNKAPVKAESSKPAKPVDTRKLMVQRLVLAAGSFIITPDESVDFEANLLELPILHQQVGLFTLGHVNALLRARYPLVKKDPKHGLHDLIHLVGDYSNGGVDEGNVSECEKLIYALAHDETRTFANTRELGVAKRIVYGLRRANPHVEEPARLYARNLSRSGTGVPLSQVDPKTLLLRYPVLIQPIT